MGGISWHAGAPFVSLDTDRLGVSSFQMGRCVWRTQDADERGESELERDCFKPRERCFFGKNGCDIDDDELE